VPSKPGCEALSQAKPGRHPEVAWSRGAIGLPQATRTGLPAAGDDELTNTKKHTMALRHYVTSRPAGRTRKRSVYAESIGGAIGTLPIPRSAREHTARPRK
jgi:hypothetical protein